MESGNRMGLPNREVRDRLGQLRMGLVPKALKLLDRERVNGSKNY